MKIIPIVSLSISLFVLVPKVDAMENDKVDRLYNLTFAAIFREHSKEKKKSFICSECGADFTALTSLNEHIRVKHTHEKPYPCNYCPEACTTIRKLKLHVKSKHPGEKVYQCKECKQGFDNKRLFSKHMDEHTIEAMYKECSPIETQVEIAAQKEKTSHSHEVAVTHKEGGQPTSIEPDEEGFYACKLCPKRVKKLKDHIKDVHLGVKPFTCDQCQKTFSHGYNMKVHKKLIHEKEQFKCTQCPRVCTTALKLDQHKRVHTGEALECPECQKIFIRDNTLREHRKTKHGKKSKGDKAEAASENSDD
jgi:KRAB domain-containing zinc finger protein